MQISIGFRHHPLALPYPAIDLPDQIRHRYIDLRSQPELIHQLPELKGAPVLCDGIQAINAPQSYFRTLGCEKAVSDLSHPTFKKKIVSYIDLAFADWNENKQLHTFFILVGEFARFCSNTKEIEAAEFRFEFQQTFFGSFGFAGWSVCVWTMGVGADDAPAAESWGNALRSFVEFLSTTRPSGT